MVWTAAQSDGEGAGRVVRWRILEEQTSHGVWLGKEADTLDQENYPFLSDRLPAPAPGASGCHRSRLGVLAGEGTLWATAIQTLTILTSNHI